MAGYDFFPDTTNSRLTLLRSSVDHRCTLPREYSVSYPIIDLRGGRDLSLLVTENTKLSSLSVKKQFSSTS